MCGEGWNQNVIDEDPLILHLTPQEKNGFVGVRAEGGAENAVRY